MKIGIDASLVVGEQAGVGWSTETSLKHWLPKPVSVGDRRRRGLEQARKFSWEQIAPDTLKVYETC